MNQVILEGGNFSGVLVEDTGDEHCFAWCEQEGVKSTVAFYGHCLLYIDLYRKHVTHEGVSIYQFVETI